MSKFHLLAGEEMPELPPKKISELAEMVDIDVEDALDRMTPNQRQAMLDEMIDGMRLRRDPARATRTPTPETYVNTMIDLGVNEPQNGRYAMNLGTFLNIPGIAIQEDNTVMRVQGLNCAIHRNSFNQGGIGCPVQALDLISNSVVMSVHLHQAGVPQEMRLGALRDLALRTNAGEYSFGFGRNGRNGSASSILRCRIDRGYLTFITMSNG